MFHNKHGLRQAGYGGTHLILGPRRLRQDDLEFQASLGKTVRSRGTAPSSRLKVSKYRQFTHQPAPLPSV